MSLTQSDSLRTIACAGFLPSPAAENQPSPFALHGPSVKGAIKPELVAAGGNLASPMRQANAQWAPHMRGFGVLTLNQQGRGNTVFKEVSGTSLAAPYITHLARCLLNAYPMASAHMLRAMLVNQAYLPDVVTSTFSEELRKSYKKAKATWNRDVQRDVAGYGVVSEADLFRSSDNVVVLMSEETIENDGCQFFELPLPEDYLNDTRLSGTKVASRALVLVLQAFNPGDTDPIHAVFLGNGAQVPLRVRVFLDFLVGTVELKRLE